MMIRIAEEIWGKALSLSPGCLIDKFLDWLDDMNVAMVPAQVGGLAKREVRAETMLDLFNA